MLGLQSPYGELIVGDGLVWKHATSARRWAGREAGWILDISDLIKVKDLKAGMLTLNAKAHGGNLIGRTAVDIQPVLDNMGKWVDISGELSNKRKRSGFLHLGATLRWPVNRL